MSNVPNFGSSHDHRSHALRSLHRSRIAEITAHRRVLTTLLASSMQTVQVLNAELHDTWEQLEEENSREQARIEKEELEDRARGTRDWSTDSRRVYREERFRSREHRAKRHPGRERSRSPIRSRPEEQPDSTDVHDKDYHTVEHNTVSTTRQEIQTPIARNYQAAAEKTGSPTQRRIRTPRPQQQPDHLTPGVVNRYFKKHQVSRGIRRSRSDAGLDMDDDNEPAKRSSKRVLISLGLATDSTLDSKIPPPTFPAHGRKGPAQDQDLNSSRMLRQALGSSRQSQCDIPIPSVDEDQRHPERPTFGNPELAWIDTWTRPLTPHPAKWNRGDNLPTESPSHHEHEDVWDRRENLPTASPSPHEQEPVWGCVDSFTSSLSQDEPEGCPEEDPDTLPPLGTATNPISIMGSPSPPLGATTIKFSDSPSPTSSRFGSNETTFENTSFDVLPGDGKESAEIISKDLDYRYWVASEKCKVAYWEKRNKRDESQLP